MTNFTYLISLDTTKTLTKGYRYRAVNKTYDKYKIMNDMGVVLWYNKDHFILYTNATKRTFKFNDGKILVWIESDLEEKLSLVHYKCRKLMFLENNCADLTKISHNPPTTERIYI